jgi:hypothetical protein
MKDQTDDYVRVTSIIGRCGTEVDMIGFEYQGDTGVSISKPHGGTGGSMLRVYLGDDEYVTEVKIFLVTRSNKRVLKRISFATNLNSNKFGCGESSSELPIEFKAGPSEAIVFMSGKSSDRINFLKLMKAPRATVGAVLGIPS